MLSFIDRLPWALLLPIAVWLGIAPVTPEPHLVEKLRLLSQGALVRPIDIFDLLMHSAPLALVGLKAWRRFRPPKA